jgi:hypothetical protein
MQFKTLPIIQIGAHTYTVEIKDCYLVTDAGGQGDSHHQKLDMRVATRTIDNGYRSVTDMEQILLHEICHGINIIWGCDMEEDNVDRLAQGLLQVLKQFGLKLIEVTDA